MSVTAQENTLLFLHIPKTAGTTLRKILHRQYDEKKIFTISYKQWPTKAKEDLAYCLKNNEKINLIKGHMPYGWHLEFDIPDFHYLIFLRDPVERVISQYFFERIPGRPLYDIASKLSLKEFVLESNVIEVDNLQTRYISGDLFSPYGHCDSANFEKAKSILESKDTSIGITERFTDSIFFCKLKFEWQQPIFFSSSNRNKKTKPKDLTTSYEEIKALIAQKNEYDLKLYGIAKQKFEEQKRSIKGFNRKLKAFKRANYLFQKLHPLYSKSKIFVLRDLLKRDMTSYV